MDDLAPTNADGWRLSRLAAGPLDGISSPADDSAQSAAPDARPPLHIGGDALSSHSDPPASTPSVHPLDRRDDDRQQAAEANRVRLAWAKLMWLLAFLAVLLAISYLVPYIAENTQYAITRGKQRAEHDFAIEHLSGSPLSQMSRAYQMVSQAVGPSVVHISTQGNENGIFTLPMGGSRSGRIPLDGQGSGFIVDPAGYILTNLHVIRDAREITVSLSDGRKVSAQIIGADRETDLAVLKIKADNLTPAQWGDSTDLHAGALVWAVGSPFGLERSITSGILSATNRAGLAGTPYQDFLQTDAAVNPGNSGGPLVNIEGQVIGVNTAIVGDAYQGISFAIPSNVARQVFERIKDDGLVRRGWLGVRLDSITDEHAKDIGLDEATGAYVAEVVQQTGGGSPAAKAGILAGDVVMKWNGKPVSGPASLSTLVAATEVGSTATVVIYRDGQEISLEIVVGLRPALE